MVRAHGFVRGRVQGVWFRESTRQRATELGLAGWVRNLHDGRVEVVFVGPVEAVQQACAFVEIGPPQARVEGIEGFQIKPADEAASDPKREFVVR